MTGKLTATDIRICEALLRQRRDALRAAVFERTRSGAGAESNTASIGVHDLKDEAFAHLLANLANTELAHAREELAAIQAALQRIADSSYGDCGDCDNPIGRERLLVQPSAERCLSCQERLERAQALPPEFTA